MADIKTTENEFRSQVVSWLNEFIKEGSYPFECATSDPSIRTESGRPKFPDVVVWLNRKAELAFCGFELKTPSTAIDDEELLENAAEKARAIKADFFVTWNMRDAIIWRTPHPEEKITHIHRYNTYDSIFQISNPDDLWDKIKQELLKDRAKQLINDLSILKREGHLHLIDADSTFFVNRLYEATKNLAPFTLNSLRNKIGQSRKFNSDLLGWAVKQGITSYEAGDPFFELVSRQILYRLLGKIIFYLTLRRFRSDIPKLDLSGIDPASISNKLAEYFKIASEIDYQAVFEEDFSDSVPIPSEGAQPLINLINDLNRYNFSSMPQDVIGNVFERLIPPEERHTLGQYFTNENLVDLIIALCVRSKSDTVLDPTCGTGTFLLRAYDRLKYFDLRDHKKLLPRIWGFDIAHFPAELATINLYRQNIDDFANFPHVTVCDFFDIKPQSILQFVAPRSQPGTAMKIAEALPAFDGIVGNFPYIRQELIEKQIKGTKNKLAKALIEDWGTDYSDILTNGDVKLSGQADIYAYLFFHAARLLKEGGRMGIITSNSWLDVAYGFELQKFFLKKFKIVAILESRCEPWFETAAVNTVVTILERCENKRERNANSVKFVKIKKRLPDLIPWDIKRPTERWFGLDKLVFKIENQKEIHLGASNIPEHNIFEDDDFRIRSIGQEYLLKEAESAGKTVKWGKYLRAPQIYFDVLKTSQDKLQPLSECAEIRFGIKTGINNFFHLTEEKINHWKIEKKFAIPLVTSPKEIESLLIDPRNIEFQAFFCNDDKKELRKCGYSGALNYIKWGEKQVTKMGKGHKRGGLSFSEVPSVRGREFWYGLGKRTPGHFVINRFINERFYFPINRKKVFIGDIAFEGRFYAKEDALLNSALMNSCITFLGVELLGRLNLGEGLLTFYGPEIAELPIPNAQGISEIFRKKILDSFDPLLKRPIASIFEEVKMKDRRAFDSIVLKSLGLDSKEYLEPIYGALTELVRERIELAKMRKKAQKNGVQRDLDKLKEQIIEEVLPDGLKQFPDEFIDSIYLKNAEVISAQDIGLKLGHYFMGRQEIYTDLGFKMEVESLAMAKYIIYAQRKDSYIYKIPKDNSIMLKSIDKYEKYLSGIKKDLIDAIFGRTLDHKLAQALANQILEDIGKPLLK
jgi:type I restriction-modification system DNA methylase subunit